MEWMFVPLKRYADFEGRSRRMEYWMFQVFQYAVVFLWLILFFVIVGASAAAGGSEEGLGLIGGLMVFLIAIFGLAMFIPNLAVTVRRFHDQDQSGWLVLLNLIPFGGLVVLVFMFLEGTHGPNKYGADPKGGYDEETFS